MRCVRALQGKAEPCRAKLVFDGTPDAGPARFVPERSKTFRKTKGEPMVPYGTKTML